MANIESICSWIETNNTRIIQNIDNESIDVFNFLKDQFSNSNITSNYLFQFVYRSYYRLDNAGLTSEFKAEYFNILQEIRQEKNLNFGNVLQRLYTFPNKKGQYSFQFSFVTKMFNTINNDLPIYDGEVARMFSFTRPYQANFSTKLQKFLKQLEIIQDGYHHIIENNLLPITTSKFDQHFISNKLSEMKKIDFIFWSAGKLFN